MRRKEIFQKITAAVLTVALAGTMGFVLPEKNKVKAESNQTQLQNPRKDANGNVIYDCVYFGNYPQSDWTGVKKEPIKWRVLSVDGDDAFLVSNCVLDEKPYNDADDENVGATWEVSTIRSWLNGYGDSKNNCKKDYSGAKDNFIDQAFTSEEQSDILTTLVINEDNTFTKAEGGNNTEDKIFLLSLNDVLNEKYGFSSDNNKNDSAKIWKATDNVYVSSFQWLRTPGTTNKDAVQIYNCGFVDAYGSVHSNDCSNGVVPALHLNLASKYYSYAGTINTGNLDNTQDDPIENPSENTQTNPSTSGNANTQSNNTAQNPSQSSNTATTSAPSVPAAVGTVLTDHNLNCQVKVLSENASNPTVSYVKSENKNAKKVSVPNTIRIKDVTYKVTEIGKNVFKKNKKLTSVVIGKNVTKIGEQAFNGCKNLKKITIQAGNLKSIGKNAFKGINKKAVITVKGSKKAKTAVKKMLKSKKVGYIKTWKIN